MEPIVTFKNVGVSFGAVSVHKDISFSLFPKEVTTILGPSGAGKTLILKLIIGLLAPTQGTVEVMGQNLSTLNEEDLRSIRVNIGMLFQGAALFDSLSIFENIAYGLRERNKSTEDEIKSIVAEKLDLVALSGIENKFPPQLSGGQKKRVGLARALATSPKIMLFDEPTTGLDPTSIRMIDDLILKLKNDHGMTCVTVTHDIQSARRFSDRWMLIKDGTIAADGPVDRVAKEYPIVASFVEGNWSEEG